MLKFRTYDRQVPEPDIATEYFGQPSETHRDLAQSWRWFRAWSPETPEARTGASKYRDFYRGLAESESVEEYVSLFREAHHAFAPSWRWFRTWSEATPDSVAGVLRFRTAQAGVLEGTS
jgi:hypothetical protein